MAKSKSDISNSAIRIFLQSVGKIYDEKRGINEPVSGPNCKKKLLNIFEEKCAYCNCNLKLTVKTKGTKNTIVGQAGDKEITIDHLVAMNQKCLGLDSWGNIVPSCTDCNGAKHDKDWRQHIKSIIVNETEANLRIEKIEKYINDMKYNPNLEIHEIVGNLYEDVGAVVETLINLRIKHAHEYINKIHK